MSHQISIDLIVNDTTLHYVSLFKLNLPEICINAITSEIRNQQEISELVSSNNPYDEIRELRSEVIRLRQEKLLEPREQQKKRLLVRITGGER